jgi:hypothetical protein
MSAITLEGKLYMIEQERAFKGEDVVRFLQTDSRNRRHMAVTALSRNTVQRSR